MGAGTTVYQYDPVKERFAVRPETAPVGAFGTVAKGTYCNSNVGGADEEE